MMRALKWLAMGLGAALLLALGGAATVYFGVVGFLRSDQPGRWAEVQLERRLGLEAEVAPVRWKGWEFECGGFSGLVPGREGGVVRRLRVDGVRGYVDFRKAFEGAWSVRGVVVERVDVDLDMGRGRLTTEVRDAEAASRGWAGSLLPRRFECGAVEVRDVRAAWWTPGAGTGLVTGVALALDPGSGASAGWEARGWGGEVESWGLGFRLVEAKVVLRASDQSISLVGLELAGKPGGVVRASGEWMGAEARGTDMTADFRDVDVGPLLGDWRARLAGRARGSVRMRGGPDGVATTGLVELVEGRLEALPAFEQIADYTGLAEFRRVRLTRAVAPLRAAAGVLEVEGLELESDGLFRVEGRVRVDGEQLSGALRVGTTARVLEKIPGARREVFVDSRGGYFWADVRLGGTLGAPEEDLTPRLKDAAYGAVVEGVVEGAVDGLRGAVDQGKRRAFEVIDWFLAP